MKNFRLFAVVTVLIIMLSVMLTGCGAPTVNLNDYVTVTVNGYDGYGSVSVSLDYEKIIADHSDRLADNLDNQIFGDKTPVLAAELAFSYYEPYSIAYEHSNTYKNGDVIEVYWNTNESAIEMLTQVLDIKCTYDNFSYTVEGLRPVKTVNPFENIEMNSWGTSGQAGFSSDGHAYIDVDEDAPEGYGFQYVEVDGNKIAKLRIKVDYSKNGSLSNGDTVHVRLYDVDPARFAQYCGIEVTCTEADIVVTTLPE